MTSNGVSSDLRPTIGAKSTGGLSVKIDNIQDQLSVISKLITCIESGIFTPRDEPCCMANMPDSPAASVPTVGRELDIILTKIYTNRERLEEILKALESQLDGGLRLVD